jgi:hypothetical protein
LRGGDGECAADERKMGECWALKKINNRSALSKHNLITTAHVQHFKNMHAKLHLQQQWISKYRNPASAYGRKKHHDSRASSSQIFFCASPKTPEWRSQRGMQSHAEL